MKIVIINTDYPEFLQWFYAQHTGLERQAYSEQLSRRYESLYGVSDFYSRNLCTLGHETHDVYFNNEYLQKAWALEHGVNCDPPEPMRQPAPTVLSRMKQAVAQTPVSRLKSYVRPVWNRFRKAPSWPQDILKAQIKHYRPDVLLNQAVDGISGEFIKELKPYVRLVVGQHAATQISEDEDLSGYDMMISSFPSTLDYFSRKGITSYLSRLGFEPSVLPHLNASGARHEVTFAGNFFAVHSSREAWMEVLCREFPQLKIWAPTLGQLPAGSVLHRHYAGQAWGAEMYQILQSSNVTLNHHGNVAPYANNMRLFEATGVGAFLLTDWKSNLSDMFDVGTELVAYRTVEECVELVRYYLAHDEEREAIARAGQARTLRDHTYAHRMRELMGIIEKHV